MSARIWFARDAQFTSDPKIEMLGHEHGPGGPLVIEEIFALAKLSNDGGRVTLLYAQIAGRAFVSPAKAKAVIARASSLRILDFVGQPTAKGATVDLPRRAWCRIIASPSILRAERVTTAPGTASPEQIAARVAVYGGLCWICRAAPYDALDHVKPLARGGSNWPANLRPACTPCNSRKGAKWPYRRPS